MRMNLQVPIMVFLLALTSPILSRPIDTAQPQEPPQLSAAVHAWAEANESDIMGVLEYLKNNPIDTSELADALSCPDPSQCLIDYVRDRPDLIAWLREQNGTPTYDEDCDEDGDGIPDDEEDSTPTPTETPDPSAGAASVGLVPNGNGASTLSTMTGLSVALVMTVLLSF